MSYWHEFFYNFFDTRMHASKLEKEIDTATQPPVTLATTGPPSKARNLFEKKKISNFQTFDLGNI
jgi:hypothetical protein